MTLDDALAERPVVAILRGVREAVVWAVGGVGPASMAEWWAAGARAFGLGAEIYRAGQPVRETAEKAQRVVSATRALI